jgi:hypothetical protein
MARKKESLPFIRVDRPHPTVPKSLPRELMGIGEVALLACREMKENITAILRDNRQIMQCNMRITATLERESEERRESGRKNRRLKGHGNRCYSTQAPREASSKWN